MDSESDTTSCDLFFGGAVTFTGLFLTGVVFLDVAFPLAAGFDLDACW